MERVSGNPGGTFSVSCFYKLNSWSVMLFLWGQRDWFSFRLPKCFRFWWLKLSLLPVLKWDFWWLDCTGIRASPHLLLTCVCGVRIEIHLQSNPWYLLLNTVTSSLSPASNHRITSWSAANKAKRFNSPRSYALVQFTSMFVQHLIRRLWYAEAEHRKMKCLEGS